MTCAMTRDMVGVWGEGLRLVLSVDPGSASGRDDREERWGCHTAQCQRPKVNNHFIGTWSVAKPSTSNDGRVDASSRDQNVVTSS
jgi:hypothetical protein